MFNFPLRFGVVLGSLISLRGTSKGVMPTHRPYLSIIHGSSGTNRGCESFIIRGTCHSVLSLRVCV